MTAIINDSPGVSLQWGPGVRSRESLEIDFDPAGATQVQWRARLESRQTKTGKS